MILAASAGDIDFVESFLQQGANINSHERLGDSPLSRATYNGLYRLVILLPGHGADANISDMLGSSLEAAIKDPSSFGCPEQADTYYEIVRLLLAQGAHASVWLEDHGSPLWLAASSSNGDMMNLLVQHGAE